MADFVGENERYLIEEDIQQKRVTTGAEKKLCHILSMRTVKRTSTIDPSVFLVFLFDLL